MSNSKQYKGEGNPDVSTQQASTTSPIDQRTRLDPSLVFRGAELQWAKSMQEATVSHQSRVASAAATYQDTLAQITREAWDKELVAIDESGGDNSSTNIGSMDTQTTETIEKWRAGLEESQGEAYRRSGAAERKFAEESQNAWFEFLEKQREANHQYMQAIKGLHAPSPARAPSTFAVAGDEGVAPMTPIMPTRWPVWTW